MGRKSLRVALVTDVYYPHVGGIQEHVYHLALELKKRGHEVRIITGSAGTNEAPGEIEVIRIGRVIQYPANKSFSKMTIGLGIAGKLLRVLRDERFDIVHVHGALSPFLPLYSHLLSQGTTVHTFHAQFEKSMPYFVFKKLLMRCMRGIEGKIAVSTAARDSIGRYLEADYTIIPNGIDTKRFSPRNEKLAKFRGISPLILYVGRFEPRKGLKFLFLAFNEIIRKIPDAGLVVVGEGRLRDYYKGFLSKEAVPHVAFEGKVSMEVLPRYFVTSDIFCSPAYTGESFGIILLEAQASGTPVIASDIQGYRTVIKDGDNGILVPPRNPDALAAAIEKIHNDQSLRKRLIRNGLESVQKYSWESVTSRIECFYFDILERSWNGKT
jgi:phosphatidylinositol alpha-mannosyltransferase